MNSDGVLKFQRRRTRQECPKWEPETGKGPAGECVGNDLLELVELIFRVSSRSSTHRCCRRVVFVVSARLGACPSTSTGAEQVSLSFKRVLQSLLCLTSSRMVEVMESSASDHDRFLLESPSKCAVSLVEDDHDPEDINEIMLRAIQPPDHTDMTFPGKDRARHRASTSSTPTPRSSIAQVSSDRSNSTQCASGRSSCSSSAGA